ncbi:MAG: putative sulfate/molybdate transporter [bacterium]
MVKEGLKFNRMELAGALGDIGTLFPLAIALITINGLNPTSVFLVVGLVYIGAGLYYRIPMPVQPLKAVAAIAIAARTSPEVIASAGLIMGLLLPVFWIKRVADFLQRVFTRPIVRGIQLGIGLILVQRGARLIFGERFFLNGAGAILSLGGIPVSILVASVGAGLLLLFRRNGRWPASILIISFGILVGLLGQDSYSLALGPLGPQLFSPTIESLWAAFILIVIPQLPLTVGNAIVATTDTARTYFGQRADRVSPRSLPVSMSLGNIVAGLFMAMPVCHGSGGLTAHYKFGARTGGANLMIGGLCLILALLLGKAAVPVLSTIPLPIIGLLLVYVGLNHALFVRDLVAKRDFLLALGVGLVAVIAQNPAFGFGAGIAFNMVLKLKAGFLWRTIAGLQKEVEEPVSYGDE